MKDDRMALVTGAAGWLGTRIVRALVKGLPDVEAFKEGNPERKIRCLLLPDESAEELKRFGGNVEIVRGDLTDAKSLDLFFADARGAVLFNASGVIHPTHGIKQLYAVNRDGVRNLLVAAIDAKVDRFLHLSSNSPFGCNRRRDELFDEDSPYNPYMHYGRSKMQGEQIVLEAGRSGQLSVVSIRSPWFYGPHQPPRQTLFFEMIRDGKVPLLGDGGNLRSMAYVDNICHGLMLCASKEQIGDRYWIADKKPYAMSEIIETVEDVLEKHFQVKVARKRIKLPHIVGGIAWAMDKMIQSTGLYHQKIHVLSEMNKTIACSVQGAEKELGYDPQIALEEGMRRSLAWLYQRGVRL
jgi:nucleoside-diphosphate-sugar epimerase